MLLKKISASLLTFVLVSACVTTVSAQNAFRPRTPLYGQHVAYPYGWGYYSPIAGVIQAKGEAAVNYSRAAINNQEALSMSMDNRKKAVEMRRELRIKGEADRAAYYAKKRVARERRKANKTGTVNPIRLTASQYDPNTGELVWPEILKNSTFIKERDMINAAFTSRNTRTYNRTESHRKVQAAAKKMSRMLKAHVRDIPAKDYMAACKFLKRLQNEERA